jgi:alcohol dehydrogenase, propanol-preferring
MKAMRLDLPQPVEGNPLHVSEIDIPSPGPGEILVRVDACGVCHTDLHIVEGELPRRTSPITPGHQIAGTIERLGGEVADRKSGDRVGIAWLQWTCGECAWCLRGEENLCVNARFTGYDVDGGFAEYVVAPSRFTYEIPRAFTSEAAAPLLCAGIIGYRSLRLSGLQPGGRLGLFGFGASAHIAIQVARYWGCEVYVFSRGENHRRHAEQLGAAWTGSADSIPPQPLDAAISFAPAGEVVPKALRTLRRGGTLALAGIYATPVPPLDYSLLYYERKITTVANNTRQDAIEFLKLAEAIPLKTEIELFSLTDANRALRLLKEGKIRGAAVLKVGG